MNASNYYFVKGYFSEVELLALQCSTALILYVRHKKYLALSLWHFPNDKMSNSCEVFLVWRLKSSYLLWAKDENENFADAQIDNDILIINSKIAISLVSCLVFCKIFIIVRPQCQN